MNKEKNQLPVYLLGRTKPKPIRHFFKPGSRVDIDEVTEIIKTACDKTAIRKRFQDSFWWFRNGKRCHGEDRDHRMNVNCHDCLYEMMESQRLSTDSD